MEQEADLKSVGLIACGFKSRLRYQLTIEKLYYEFSERYCAQWLRVNDNILEEFSNWLDEYDI